MEAISKFLKEHKEFFSDIVNKLDKASSHSFIGKTLIVVLALILITFLTFYGKISGETLAGLIGLILGFYLGKGR